MIKKTKSSSKILKNFFTNSVGIFVSRILGFFRDMLTANTLGASIWSDIFFVAFKLPNLFRRLFGEGAFTQAFLPGFTKARKKGLFAAAVFIKFLAFIMFLTLLVMLFAGLFTKLIAIGFDRETVNLATPFVRINFIYLIFIFMVTLFASMLQYRGHFATTAFSTALLNISMIVSLFISLKLEVSKEMAVFYLSIGVVVGGFLQALVHIIAMKKVKILKSFLAGFKGLKMGKKPDTKGFYKGFFHGVIGSSAMQISSFIDTWFASFLAAGSISYLYYANRIFQLPLALFAIALSTALFPPIARAIKNSNDEKAHAMLSKSFHILLGLLLFSTIGGIMLSGEIISLLFERGEFSKTDTINASKVFIAYMIGLLPFGLVKIFSLFLYAKMKQNIAAKIAIKSLILNAILCAIFIRPFGASGLALASSIGGFYLFFMNLKEFGFRNFLAIISLKKISIILLLSLAEIFILYIFKGLIDGYI